MKFTLNICICESLIKKQWLPSQICLYPWTPKEGWRPLERGSVCREVGTVCAKEIGYLLSVIGYWYISWDHRLTVNRSTNNWSMFPGNNEEFLNYRIFLLISKFAIPAAVRASHRWCTKIFFTTSINSTITRLFYSANGTPLTWELIKIKFSTVHFWGVPLAMIQIYCIFRFDKKPDILDYPRGDARTAGRL